MRNFVTAILLIAVMASGLNAQQVKFKKHGNVVYGMISGMALLMDVYQPEESNHRGIIFINGSAFGWEYQSVYNQLPLKVDYTGDPYTSKYAQQLVDRGYTVFYINHRFAPRFHFPDIFYDCQRAVKYIRYHAKAYNIDPNFIGAMGHSSGANLCSMLGVADTTYPNVDKNPIDSLSGKVQAVVALAAPHVLSDVNARQDFLGNFLQQVVFNYIGELPALAKDTSHFELSGKYAGASPITHVSKNDAPMLLYHSTDDFIIPFRQAVAINKKLLEVGVPTKLVIRQNQGHNPEADMEEVDQWFKKYLKK